MLANDNAKDEVKEYVKIVSTGIDNSNRFKRMFLSRRKLSVMAIGIDADIYQIHDPELLPLGLRLLMRGKYVVYDSHEDFPNQILEKDWIPGLFRKLLSRLVRAYFKRNLKKFSAILAVTPHIVKSLSIASDKVYLVTNYPLIENDFHEFSSDEYSKRESKLCYSGTVYRTSLQENLLEALSDLKSVCYLIVGTIDENYLNELNKHKAWDRVEFLKRVPREELIGIYQETTVGIGIFDYSPNLGYKKGSLGINKNFEYMHAALPIISTDFEIWKEIIDKYKCGIYVNPHNVDEIRNAISFMSSNKEDAYRMGQNGRRAVMEEYNWQTQEKVYLGVIRNVLSHKTE